METHGERGLMPPLVLEEARRIEEAMREKDQELTLLMEDPSARLGTILEVKRDRLELHAYLRGLRFLQDALGR
jgi:hypothetical protein